MVDVAGIGLAVESDELLEGGLLEYSFGLLSLKSVKKYIQLESRYETQQEQEYYQTQFHEIMIIHSNYEH